MDSQKEVFSLEVNEIENQLEVFLNLDSSSLEMLISDLCRLKEAGDHTHYMSGDWGGVSLTTQPSDKKHKIVHHFQITKI